MKRNFATRSFGSLVGFGMALILLSVTTIAGAHGADVRTDVSRAHDVSAATLAPATRQPSHPSRSMLGPATIITPTAAQDLAFAMGVNPSDLISATLNGSD